MRWLLWLCILAALIDLRAFGLTDLDEGFYASVAWEMRQSGDWFTPTFLNQPWFEKPPLLYWLMGVSMRVFGENEFALRLPSVLFYALTIGLLAWWGNRRLGQGAGSWGALLFAVAPLSLILARLAITDMALTFFLTLAVIALWEARGLGWSLLGGIALGLAVLTKGPFGLGLVGLLYFWNAKRLYAHGVRFRWVGVALAVALLTALPWYVGVYLQHGAEFFSEFVVKQNLLRFAGGDTAHSVLPLIQRGDFGGVLTGVAVYLLFYGVVLWLGALPMVGYGSVLWRGEGDPVRLYLRRWAWLVFGLFTLSFTKLPAYIFPMFPVFALLAGAEIVRIRLRVIAPDSPSPFTQSGARWVRLGVSFGLILGAAVWCTVALYAPLWQNAFWVVTLVVGVPLTVFAFWNPVAPLGARVLGVLALLIGWNGALTGYDRLALKPVRELALKPPPYRTLILYRVNPGYPSIQFYRKGHYATSDDAETTLQQMQRTGAYCLTTDAAFVRRAEVFVLAEAQVMGKRFYLTAPRYKQQSPLPSDRGRLSQPYSVRANHLVMRRAPT
ncbi:MAG: dolichyl-phosphate-mannose--protein mannosyltransferase [Fimbriimonadales bacterium]|nr:MAG: dolichyl-phosphate-mannose--protein mannosyltransferase [Fimbriimonadales bacterium]GIV07905.1 MAG: dolichyl-phosphate-mannose--protein mannosyltransferase [Fimbriimonadales bacterium]GIV07909.1 MAG: dolichyl-phosphate-mannose--protein mannosyltransferase [Fimbriimonadales bacterium]